MVFVLFYYLVVRHNAYHRLYSMKMAFNFCSDKNFIVFLQCNLSKATLSQSKALFVCLAKYVFSLNVNNNIEDTQTNPPPTLLMVKVVSHTQLYSGTNQIIAQT